MDEATSTHWPPGKRPRLFDLLGSSRGMQAMRIAASASGAALGLTPPRGGQAPAAAGNARVAPPPRLVGDARSRFDFDTVAFPTPVQGAATHLFSLRAHGAQLGRPPASQVLLNRARGSAPSSTRAPSTAGPCGGSGSAPTSSRSSALLVPPRAPSGERAPGAPNRFDRCAVADHRNGGVGFVAVGNTPSVCLTALAQPEAGETPRPCTALATGVDENTTLDGAMPAAWPPFAASGGVGAPTQTVVQATTEEQKNGTPAKQKGGRRMRRCGHPGCGSRISKKAAPGKQHFMCRGFVYCPTARGAMTEAQRAEDIVVWRSQLLRSRPCTLGAVDTGGHTRAADPTAPAPQPALSPHTSAAASPPSAEAPSPAAPPSKRSLRAGGRHARVCRRPGCLKPLRRNGHRRFGVLTYCPWSRGALTDAEQEADFARWKAELLCADDTTTQQAPPPCSVVPRRPRSARPMRVVAQQPAAL